MKRSAFDDCMAKVGDINAMLDKIGDNLDECSALVAKMDADIDSIRRSFFVTFGLVGLAVLIIIVVIAS